MDTRLAKLVHKTALLVEIRAADGVPMTAGEAATSASVGGDDEVPLFPAVTVGSPDPVGGSADDATVGEVRPPVGPPRRWPACALPTPSCKRPCVDSTPVLPWLVKVPLRPVELVAELVEGQSETQGAVPWTEEVSGQWDVRHSVVDLVTLLSDLENSLAAVMAAASQLAGWVVPMVPPAVVHNGTFRSLAGKFGQWQ